MGILVPVPPASGDAGPVALALPPKPIPLPLSGQLNPSAFITNLWLSTRLCSRGFSRSELLLIARSLPRSELGGGASQPVVFRLQRPACTALLSPTGMLFIMGGITKEQALWQAFRVAYKIKYRIWWKPASKVRLSGYPKLLPRYTCELSLSLYDSCQTERFTVTTVHSASERRARGC